MATPPCCALSVLTKCEGGLGYDCLFLGSGNHILHWNCSSVLSAPIRFLQVVLHAGFSFWKKTVLSYVDRALYRNYISTLQFIPTTASRDMIHCLAVGEEYPGCWCSESSRPREKAVRPLHTDDDTRKGGCSKPIGLSSKRTCAFVVSIELCSACVCLKLTRKVILQAWSYFPASLVVRHTFFPLLLQTVIRIW